MACVYTPNTDFSVKDALPPGDPQKRILGSDFDAEFNEIATTFDCKLDAASGTATGTTTFEDVTITGDSNIGGPTSTTVIDGDVTFTSGTVTGARPAVINDATTARTFALTDESAVIVFSNAGAITVTCPANATVACPIGFISHVYQQGTGQITVEGASGVTVNSSISLKTRAQYSSLSLVKIATDEWYLIGDMAAA